MSIHMCFDEDNNRTHERVPCTAREYWAAINGAGGIGSLSAGSTYSTMTHMDTTWVTKDGELVCESNMRRDDEQDEWAYEYFVFRRVAP